MMIPIKDSYSFAEIIEAQSKKLDEKIEYAVSILQIAFKMSCHNVALAFEICSEIWKNTFWSTVFRNKTVTVGKTGVEILFCKKACFRT